MARSRNIKPGLFQNEVLGVADPIYTLAFEGLWLYADREGRLEDRPIRVGGQIFPYRREVDMNAVLDWLAANEFIVRYQVSGKRYIQVLNFAKHQNPHKNETESEIPAPEEIGSTPEIIGTSSEKIGSTPADSLLLIPDSLLTPLSGKPDVSAARAIEVIEFLNESAKRNYKPVKANVSLIAARLKEGATVEDCRAVITDRCGKWAGNPKMVEYLRPKTLFNATNFAQYQGELGTKGEDWRRGMI